MGFSHTGRSEQDHLGPLSRSECQEMLELHAVKMGWQVPVPAEFWFDKGSGPSGCDGETIFVSEASSPALSCSRNEVSGLVLSGLPQHFDGHFEQIDKDAKAGGCLLTRQWAYQ